MSVESQHYFCTESARDISWLIGVLEGALERHQKVRFYTHNQTLHVKRGEGTWSAPLVGTMDPYRDSKGPKNEITVEAHRLQAGDILTAYSDVVVTDVVDDPESDLRVIVSWRRQTAPFGINHDLPPVHCDQTFSILRSVS